MNLFIGKAVKKVELQKALTDMISSKEAQGQFHTKWWMIKALLFWGDYVDSSLTDIDAVFLDLDGTMYLGNELIPGALEFLERCEARGVRRFFLSNNSSRSVDQYVQKLNGLRK